MKDAIKRVIIVFVTAAVFVSFFSCAVLAADEDIMLIYPTGDGFESIGFEKDLELKTEEEANLMSDTECYEYMAQQCLLRKEEVDIHRFNIPIDDKEDFWYNFIMSHPELPLETSFEFDYWPDETIICSYYPIYINETLEEDEEIRQILNNGINQLLACAANCDDTLGKLLIIHDEIIRICDYDMDYGKTSHNAYACFTNHKMVCQGYTQLFGAICKRLGVEYGFCRSKEINHVWNYVRINGKWYHVDLTWDDPVVRSQPSGQIVSRPTAKHAFFLVSDEKAINGISEDTKHGEKSTWLSSLGYVPDCDDTFESRHIFNLPYDFTISYDGERFSVPYKVNKKTTVNLTSEDVYTGEIITSEIQKDSSYLSQYYYCLEDIGTNVNFIVLTKSSSGSFLTITQSNEGKKDKETVYSVLYRMRNVPKNAEISFMYWKKGTMKPFTAGKKIINK
ncbi:MAG: hypothetical protein J5590_09040 [Clostridia bacterium]|nr:hypothetical protein [Clostridia bacterium]